MYKIQWISTVSASGKNAVTEFFDTNPNIEIISAGDMGIDFYVVYKEGKEKKEKKEKEKKEKPKKVARPEFPFKPKKGSRKNKLK